MVINQGLVQFVTQLQMYKHGPIEILLILQYFGKKYLTKCPSQKHLSYAEFCIKRRMLK